MTISALLYWLKNRFSGCQLWLADKGNINKRDFCAMQNTDFSVSTKMPPPTMCMELPAYLPDPPARHTHCNWPGSSTMLDQLFSLTHPEWEPSVWLGRVPFLWSNYCGFNVLNLRANYIIFTLKCCDKELYNKGEAVMKAKIYAIVH